MLSVSFPSGARAQELLGIIKGSEGPVTVDRPTPPPGRVVTVKAGSQEDVFEGDVIKTGLGAKALILLKDQTEITLGEEAEFEVTNVLFDPTAGQRSTTVRVLHGLARAVVPPIPNQKESVFTIETPTAVIGVRGSEGVADVENENTKFYCLDDTWRARNSDPNVPGDVPCPPKHFTEVSSGKAPTKALLIPAALLLQLQLATTLSSVAGAGGAAGVGAGTVAAGAGALGVAGAVTGIVLSQDNNKQNEENPPPGESCPDTGDLADTTLNTRQVVLQVWDDGDDENEDVIDLQVNGNSIVTDLTLTFAKQDIPVSFDCGLNELTVTGKSSIFKGVVSMALSFPAANVIEGTAEYTSKEFWIDEPFPNSVTKKVKVVK